jgi:hypothetical protein
MDYAVETYIAMQFHPSMANLIMNIFNVLNIVEDPFSDQDFLDILSKDDTLDNSGKQDAFILLLHDRLDAIIKAHKLTLISTADLEFKLDIIAVFNALQNTDQYEFILSILQTFDEPVDKLARIISFFTTREECDILAYIDNFQDGEDILAKLQMYLERQSLLNSVDEDTTDTIKALRVLRAHYENQFILGISLFEGGVNLSLSYDKILPLAKTYFKSISKENLLQFVKDVISLTILTKNNNPIKPLDLYKKIAGSYLDDLTQITKGENLLLTEISALSRYEDLLP